MAVGVCVEVALVVGVDVDDGVAVALDGVAVGTAVLVGVGVALKLA